MASFDHNSRAKVQFPTENKWVSSAPKRMEIKVLFISCDAEKYTNERSDKALQNETYMYMLASSCRGYKRIFK